MKAYPSHYNEWLILISIVSDQLLICKFAVFTYFYFIFTDGSRDLPCLLARSLSRPNSSYIVQTWCLWLGTLLFGYQAVAYYNVVAYKRWSRNGGSTVLTKLLLHYFCSLSPASISAFFLLVLKCDLDLEAICLFSHRSGRYVVNFSLVTFWTINSGALAGALKQE